MLQSGVVPSLSKPLPWEVEAPALSLADNVTAICNQVRALVSLFSARVCRTGDASRSSANATGSEVEVDVDGFYVPAALALRCAEELADPAFVTALLTRGEHTEVGSQRALSLSLSRLLSLGVVLSCSTLRPPSLPLALRSCDTRCSRRCGRWPSP